MGYLCPYCHVVCYNDGTIQKHICESFEHSGSAAVEQWDSGAVVLTLTKCPNCQKVAVSLHSRYPSVERIAPYSYPPANAIELPDYIPPAVCQDYLEALSIIDLSPKASATLARRCLQGMIHDFWNVQEKNLNAEISALKEKVSPAQWQAMDALRKVGNIGAHMENDINVIVDVAPGEAASLLRLIELLIEKWYIARHDEESLLSEITNMAEEKEAERSAPVDGQ